MVHYIYGAKYSTLLAMVQCTGKYQDTAKWHNEQWKARKVTLPEFTTTLENVTCRKCLSMMRAKAQVKVDRIDRIVAGLKDTDFDLVELCRAQTSLTGSSKV